MNEGNQRALADRTNQQNINETTQKLAQLIINQIDANKNQELELNENDLTTPVLRSSSKIPKFVTLKSPEQHENECLTLNSLQMPNTNLKTAPPIVQKARLPPPAMPRFAATTKSSQMKSNQPFARKPPIPESFRRKPNQPIATKQVTDTKKTTLAHDVKKPAFSMPAQMKSNQPIARKQVIPVPAQLKPNQPIARKQAIPVPSQLKSNQLIAKKQLAIPKMTILAHDAKKQPAIPKTTNLVHDVKNEIFTPLRNLDFDNTEFRTPGARPSIMNVNLLDPVSRANFISQKSMYERQQKSIAFNDTLRTPHVALKTPQSVVQKKVKFALPSPGIKFEAIPESSQEKPIQASGKEEITNSDPKEALLMPDANENFTPLKNFDSDNADVATSMARLSIMDVDLLNPVSRANFITQESKRQQKSIAFNDTLRTPHVALKTPQSVVQKKVKFALPSPAKLKFEAILESPPEEEPSQLTPKKQPTIPKTTNLVHDVKNEIFTPLRNLDFDDAEFRTPMARPSIMNIDLMNPVSRANYINQISKYERQQKSVAFNETLQTPVAAFKTPQPSMKKKAKLPLPAAPKFETVHVPSQKKPTQLTPKKQPAIPKTKNLVHDVKNEIFTPLRNLDFDNTEFRTPGARPSIMNIDLLNPVSRANYINQMREYERQHK